MQKPPYDNDDLLRKVKEQMQSALAQSNAETPPPQPDSLDAQIDAGESAIRTVQALGSVEGLPEPTREESVEEARKILRWLRNMEFGEQDLEQWLDNSSPKVMTAKKQQLARLIRIVAVQIESARKRAEKEDDPYLSNAADAISAMALSIAEQTFNLLPLQHRRRQELEELIDAMEERALMRQSQSIDQLLDALEFGLERAGGQDVSDLSPAYRLQMLSQQLANTANALNCGEPLAEPSREESFDLARDIMRKMQAVAGGQTVDDLVNRMNADDKVAFAHQVNELATMYRNLIAEASQSNPELLKNQQVQQANDAINEFKHAVNLMAAKEIPSSIATAQQISADITQDPEKWGDLHSRTVDRLIKSAEGGLEKAIDDMAQQQDEEQQEEQQQQEAIESALNSMDQRKRRKKRRGDSKSRSGKGGKKQRRVNADMTADDYSLKQGRFAEDAQMARVGSDVPIPALKPEDFEAIRRLGSSLRDIGSQLKDLSASVSNVSANDKIMPSPNEQSAAQRILDNSDQPRPNPRSTGPGI
jgi:hypothetical protein